MKMETTLEVRAVFSAANMAGGFAPRLPAIAPFPIADDGAAYPK